MCGVMCGPRAYLAVLISSQFLPGSDQHPPKHHNHQRRQKSLHAISMIRSRVFASLAFLVPVRQRKGVRWLHPRGCGPLTWDGVQLGARCEQRMSQNGIANLNHYIDGPGT